MPTYEVTYQFRAPVYRIVSPEGLDPSKMPKVSIIRTLEAADEQFAADQTLFDIEKHYTESRKVMLFDPKLIEVKDIHVV